MNKKFGVGNVLAMGFGIWARNFVPFLVITALFYSPVLIWNIRSLQGEVTRDRGGDLAEAMALGQVAILPLGILVSAALTYGVVMELQGQRASLLRCITTGLRRFFPVLGVAILSVLAVLGGAVLLLVPGVIAYCMLYVATQCAVLERPGVLGALRRSRALTEGHKLKIFAVIVILGVLNFALQELVTLLTFRGRDDLGRYVYALLAERMVFGSITAVMGSVAYYLLRGEKEGTSADELAAIFD